MTARVYVSLKPSVLDPQGQAIRHALAGLGHADVTQVRQGKYFDIQIGGAADMESVRRQVDRIAADVLANPVIEDYRVEYLD